MADPASRRADQRGDQSDSDDSSGQVSGVDVIVEDHQTDVVIDATRWAGLACSVLRSEHARGELTLTFVGADDIAELNREHMGAAGPTDVLSFPLDTVDAAPLDGEPVLLGDIVVCPSVAAAAAPEHAGTIDDELALLVVHGCLHVLGYDHADTDDARAMRARELELLIAHHWCGPAPDGFRQEQE